jgi:hypothetical protein
MGLRGDPEIPGGRVRLLRAKGGENGIFLVAYDYDCKLNGTVPYHQIKGHGRGFEIVLRRYRGCTSEY